MLGDRLRRIGVDEGVLKRDRVTVVVGLVALQALRPFFGRIVGKSTCTSLAFVSILYLGGLLKRTLAVLRRLGMRLLVFMILIHELTVS